MSDISKWSIDPNAELSQCHCDLCGFPMAIYGNKLRCVFRNCIIVTAPEKVIRIVSTEGEKAK
jgi:hypothetical protein